MAYGPFNPAGGGGSSAIAEVLGLYIDSNGYLCQRVKYKLSQLHGSNQETSNDKNNNEEKKNKK